MNALREQEPVCDESWMSLRTGLGARIWIQLRYRWQLVLLDRRIVLKNERIWYREYRGRYQDGHESDWKNEEEAQNRFTSLQLDAFRAFWEHIMTIWVDLDPMDIRARTTEMPSFRNKH